MVARGRGPTQKAAASTADGSSTAKGGGEGTGDLSQKEDEISSVGSGAADRTYDKGRGEKTEGLSQEEENASSDGSVMSSKQVVVFSIPNRACGAVCGVKNET